MSENDQSEDNRANTNQLADKEINQPASAQNDSPKATTDSRKSVEERIADYNKWLTISTGVLAVSTIFLFAATAGLWWFAAEQAHDMKISIENGQEANRIARIALSSDRAWVSYYSISHSPINKGTGLQAQVQYTNSGRSPAFDLQATVRAYLTDPKQIVTDPIDFSGNASITTLLTGQQTTRRAILDAKLLDDYLEDLLAGKIALRIIGYCRYKDSSGFQHESKLMLQYNPSTAEFDIFSTGNSAN